MDNEADTPKESPQILYVAPQPTPDDDEIDLRELWHTLMRRKWTVIATTALVVIASLVYVFVSTPVYEAKAFIKVGTYISNKSDRVSLEPIRQLLESLDDLQAYVKYDLSAVSVSIPDKKASYLQLSTNNSTGEKAKQTLENSVNDILFRHKSIFDAVTATVKNEIANLESRIGYYTNTALPQKMKELESLQTLQTNRLSRNVQPSEYNLEMDYLLKEIISGKDAEIKEITDITLPGLNTRITELRNNLKPPFTEMTSLSGNISVSNSPVKPNKKMILAVALVAGVMLGIFLVFFLEFIKPKKTDE